MELSDDDVTYEASEVLRAAEVTRFETSTSRTPDVKDKGDETENTLAFPDNPEVS